jgi:hypothetical protein
MDVEGYGWFGKVKEPSHPSREWTYGPSPRIKEAKEAVARYLRQCSTTEDWDNSHYGSIFLPPKDRSDIWLSQYRVPPQETMGQRETETKEKYFLP